MDDRDAERSPHRRPRDSRGRDIHERAPELGNRQRMTARDVHPENAAPPPAVRPLQFSGRQPDRDERDAGEVRGHGFAWMVCGSGGGPRRKGGESVWCGPFARPSGADCRQTISGSGTKAGTRTGAGNRTAAQAGRTAGARCAAGAGRNSAGRGPAQSAAAAGSSALSTITGVSKYEIRGSAP